MPISLGDITFGIGPDTTRLRSSIADITNFGRAVEAASTAAAGGASQVVTALMRQESAAISALQKVQRFQDQVGRTAAPTNLAAGFNQLSTTALDRFTQRMTSGQLTALQYQREMERFNQTMTNSQRILAQWTAAQKQAEASSMVGTLQKLSGAAVLVAGPLSGIATRISVVASLADHFSVAWAGTIVGIAAGAFTFYKFATAAIEVEKQLQSVMQTLTAVTGNATIAGVQLNYLSTFADKAGVKFQDMAKGYAQIEAAAKGTNLEGERSNKIFEVFTMTGAKLGLSMEDTTGILKALMQMMSKGQVQAEELRGQLGDRLPGAIQLMAQALGVTTQKLQTMMKAGELGMSTLVKFADAAAKRYGIDDSTKIDTITAAENRLANARTRMIDSLDKVIGFSSAYQNVLNAITNAINGSTGQTTEFIKQIVAAGLALTAAFIATPIINSLGAITFGIARLTTGIWALNAATAAGAFTSFVKLLATATIAVAAYYGSEKLLSDAMDGTKQSFLNAKPAVDDYIKAQEKLVTTVRGPTLQYIQETKDQLASLKQLQDETMKLASPGLAKLDLAKGLGATADQLDAISESTGLTKLNQNMLLADAAVKKTEKDLAALNDILKRQTDEENKQKPDPKKEATTRQTVALKNAADTVKELNTQYDNLFKAPGAKEWGNLQNDISKQIENFRDQLTRTELPASKVTQLTNEYAAALRKVKEGDFALAHTTSYFQATEGIFSRGLDTGLSAWVATITEGKSRMEALTDTAKAVAADILKTFMTLAALNPLKNFLFGTNYNTLGGNAGVSGGGFFGSLFGSGSGTTAATGSVNVGDYAMPTFGFANGGIMTAGGAKPLRHYAGGGIANSSQFAEFGEGSRPEAFVPLPDGRNIPVRMEGAGGGIAVHVHEAQGTKARIATSQGADGARLDVHLQRIAVGGAIEDIAGGGILSQTLEKQYGLRRTNGMSS